ncbi:unnamed protein product [Symbiodinium sp. KB8]|nr:unnamed protein product [Symbiodinium sp. KB8]
MAAKSHKACQQGSSAPHDSPTFPPADPALSVLADVVSRSGPALGLTLVRHFVPTNLSGEAEATQAPHTFPNTTAGCGIWLDLPFTTIAGKGETQIGASSLGKCVEWWTSTRHGSLAVSAVQRTLQSLGRVLCNVREPLVLQAVRRPRRRGRGKGDQAKGKDEQAKGGKGLQQEPATIATSSKAPTLEGLPQPPKAAAVSAPKNALAQAASSTTPAEKQLDALVKALRSSKGQIPQEAQQMLDQLQQTQTQQEAKSMHRAVSQQSTAKKEIEKIKTARALYLQHWSQYIQGLADLLQQQMEEQEAVLTTFDDKEAQWQEALGKASTELQQLTKHGAPQEISDTEADMEAAEEQVDRAIAEEQQEAQTRADEATREGLPGSAALTSLPLPAVVDQFLSPTSDQDALQLPLHQRVRLAPGACTANLPLAFDHGRTWGHHVMPSDPPALLGKIGPPRPSHISKLSLARVDVLPTHLSQYPVAEIPVDQLGLYALDPGKCRQIMRFSVFDQDRHHVHRTASQEWSLSDLVSEAIRSYHEPVRSAQVLEQHMPGLATPQIVLTPQSSRPNELCVPIDMRPFGGRPCTLLLQAGSQAADVVRTALHACPHGPIFLPPSHDGRDLHLLDARGQVWHELPHDLSQLQWLRISGTGPLEVLTTEEDFMSPSASLPMGTTTATSTWVGHSVVEHVSFVLTGMGITIRLHPQHVSQVRIADSIADLVMALARQRAMPPRARLVLTAGQPHPQTRRHVTILLLLYPEDHRRHVVLDPSSDGSMAQSISVDAQTCPEELVAAAQAREGYVAVVNGCPQAASRRVLYNGDYTQVVRMPAQHRVAPTDWFYELFPELRWLAFPIVIPRLERATLNPLEPMVQTVVRDAFLRYLRQRFAERAQSMGQPAADTQAVIVHGAAHAPALLYVPGRICPVLSEVEEALQATGLFAEGTTFADSCQLTHQHAPLFLSVPPGMQNLGIFFPVPTFWMGYHLMWLPPGSSIGAFTLPTRRGFVIYEPEQMHQAAAATTRSAAAPPPERLARGTSLVQLPNEGVRRQKRCLALQAAHNLPDCECLQGRLQCPPDTASGGALSDGLLVHDPLPARPLPAVTVVPTPLGRRRIRSPSDVAVPAEADKAPCNLCLDELIPVTKPVQAEAALRFPLPADVEEHAFEAFDLRHLQESVPCAVPLVPAAASFLAAIPRNGPTAPCDALMLFVDGSHRDSRSAWAVAVLGRHCGQWLWLGFRAGRVPQACSGASAFEAELWAQLVALGIAARAALPAVILYDSQSAALVAHGATTNASSDPLQATVASLACYVRCNNQAIGFRYIPSHQGNPGNELADGLAKFHLAWPESADVFSCSLVADVLANNYKWLWLCRATATMPQWPRLDADGCSQPCRHVQPAAPQSCPRPCYGAPQEQPATAAAVPLQALFLTYNTLSCKANLQRHCLQQFMQTKGAAVLALQETRHDAPPLTIVGGTIRVASAPLEGQFGCQLWLRAVGPLTFDRHRLSIVCSEPRLLIVLAHTTLCRIAFIVAHAPTAVAPTADREAWWNHLEARLARLPPSAVPVICCDANARYTWQAGREVPANANAIRLQQILEKYDLCRTSSYAPDGSMHVTWRSPQGCPACLDYVLFPCAWESGMTTLSGLGLLDMHAGIDHEVLGAELQLQLQAPARRAVELDRDSMLTPWGRQAIASLFASARQRQCYTCAAKAHSRYTHLGSIRDGSADVSGDIRRRLGLAREAEKRDFVFSLVLSRLMHNAGTWVLHTNGLRSAYRKGYVGLLRACVRLRVLAATTAKGYLFLQALLLHERQWWNQALEDVRIVADILCDPRLTQWTNEASRAADFLPWPLTPRATANLLRRFRKAAVASRADIVETAVAKAKTHDAADRAGVSYAVLPAVRAYDPECHCRVCHALFSTRAAAASHMAKRHGIHAASYSAVGTACQACMRQFWSTARLKQHLRASSSCACTYEGADLEVEATVPENCDQRLPPVPLIGPRPFWGTLCPPPPLQPHASADVRFQIPANHSRSSCVPLIIQHFRRLMVTCGPDQAVSILDAFAPTGEYGQLAKLAARTFLAQPTEPWSESTETLTIIVYGDQLAYGPLSAVCDFGPALFA